MVKRAARTDDLIDPFLNFDELPNDALVDLETVRKLLHCSIGTVVALAKNGDINKPVRFGKQIVRWNVGELREKMRAMREADP